MKEKVMERSFIPWDYYNDTEGVEEDRVVRVDEIDALIETTINATLKEVEEIVEEFRSNAYLHEIKNGWGLSGDVESAIKFLEQALTKAKEEGEEWRTAYETLQYAHKLEIRGLQDRLKALTPKK
jgi:hypothetical protein